MSLEILFAGDSGPHPKMLLLCKLLSGKRLK